MEGRWTLHVCKDCGQRAHYQDRCPKDRRRVWTEQVEVPVVPCDDAAIERVAQALMDTEYGTDSYKARAARLLGAAASASVKGTTIRRAM